MAYLTHPHIHVHFQHSLTKAFFFAVCKRSHAELQLLWGFSCNPPVPPLTIPKGVKSGLHALPSVSGADKVISLKICCSAIAIQVLQSKVMHVTVIDCLGLRVACLLWHLLVRYCTYTAESYPSKHGAVLVHSLIVIQLGMFLLTSYQVVGRPVHRAQHH